MDDISNPQRYDIFWLEYEDNMLEREGNEVILSKWIQAYHDPTCDLNKQIEQIQMTWFIVAILPKTCAVVVCCNLSKSTRDDGNLVRDLL